MAYKQYRGIGVYRRRRRAIIALVLVLLLLGAAAAYGFSAGYLTFTENGLRFNLLAKSDDTPPDVVVEPSTTPSTDTTQGTTEPTTTEPPAPPAEYHGALLLDADRLTDSTYVDAQLSVLEQYGMTSVAVTVKDKSGTVRIPCASQYAEGAVAEDAEQFLAALDTLRAKGIRLVAMVSALRDNVMPRTFRECATKTNSSLWLDREYTTWLDPYQDVTRVYLTDLIVACRDAGFSEVLLYHFSFANIGKTNMITYQDGGVDKADALAALASSLRDATEGKLALSVLLTDQTVAEGADALAGQDATKLCNAVDKVYLPMEKPDTDLLSGFVPDRPEDCRVAAYLTDGQPLSASEYPTFDYLVRAQNYEYQ